MIIPVDKFHLRRSYGCHLMIIPLKSLKRTLVSCYWRRLHFLSESGIVLAEKNYINWIHLTIKIMSVWLYIILLSSAAVRQL